LRARPCIVHVLLPAPEIPRPAVAVARVVVFALDPTVLKHLEVHGGATGCLEAKFTVLELPISGKARDDGPGEGGVEAVALGIGRVPADLDRRELAVGGRIRAALPRARPVTEERIGAGRPDLRARAAEQ